MTTLASRRSICRLLIGVLVSTQLAIAAYACSGTALLEQQQPAAAMAGHGRAGSVASDPAAAMNPGDGMGTGYGSLDPALPNLCASHYQFGQQSAGSPPAPAVPEALLISRYTLPPLGGSSRHVRPLGGTTGPLAAADPPHAILHCCFRD